MRSYLHNLRRLLTRPPQMQLDARVIGMLDRLEVVHWFAQVGQPLAADEPVLLLASWQDAVEHAISPANGEFVLEPANELRANVFRVSPQHAQTWNAVVQQIKPHSELLAERKISAAQLPHNIVAAITGTVHWDMIHILLAFHFLDSYRSTYYEHLLEWYLRGHFPCGWQGAYPQGAFIVY